MKEKEKLQKLFNTILNPALCGDLGEFCDVGWIVTVDEARKIAEEFGLVFNI